MRVSKFGLRTSSRTLAPLKSTDAGISKTLPVASRQILRQRRFVDSYKNLRLEGGVPGPIHGSLRRHRLFERKALELRAKPCDLAVQLAWMDRVPGPC